mmetsp:Transcript_66050/g.190605  ORF Transcript_66050/g.190605 Transcript_66050/m.190605 type:complete len:277 (+) Transcript_66050:3044-3874(+)
MQLAQGPGRAVAVVALGGSQCHRHHGLCRDPAAARQHRQQRGRLCGRDAHLQFGHVEVRAGHREVRQRLGAEVHVRRADLRVCGLAPGGSVDVAFRCVSGAILAGDRSHRVQERGDALPEGAGPRGQWPNIFRQGRREARGRWPDWQRQELHHRDVVAAHGGRVRAGAHRWPGLEACRAEYLAAVPRDDPAGAGAFRQDHPAPQLGPLRREDRRRDLGGAEARADGRDGLVAGRIGHGGAGGRSSLQCRPAPASLPREGRAAAVQGDLAGRGNSVR